jgi:hypothetical protein
MSLTVQEITDFVATKAGVTDTAAKTTIKGFARRRHDIIWDSYLWKESKVSESHTAISGVQDVTLTSAIDKVIRVRWNDYQILPITQEQVFQLNAPAFDRDGPVLSFSLLPKSDSGLSKIRLFEIPQESKELLVLGKAPKPSLSNDTDTSPLSGVDQAWIAYVNGDVMQWMRQFSKAKDYFVEARHYHDKMIELETEQAAHQTQIIPADDGAYGINDIGFNWIYSK